MDQRSTDCMAEEWRKQWLSGQWSCRSPIGAASRGAWGGATLNRRQNKNRRGDRFCRCVRLPRRRGRDRRGRQHGCQTGVKNKHEPKCLLSLNIDEHIDPTTREWICVDENGNMLFPEASEQKAVELGVKFEAWLLARLNPEQERWLRILGSQLRANADTLTEAMPKHFTYFHTFSPSRKWAVFVRRSGCSVMQIRYKPCVTA